MSIGSEQLPGLCASEAGPESGSARRRRRVELTILVALGLIFVFAFVRTAWVMDDAYITFRVVDNLVHGRGLTWNPGERVQVFTHPLWMLVMSAAYAITGDVFRTSVAVSFLLCLAALGFGLRTLREPGGLWRGGLFLGLVLSSKAVMDYTSSGLENALSYFLAALFFRRLLREDTDRNSPRFLREIWWIGSLAFVNRHDTILLYLPVLFWLTWRTARVDRFAVGRPLLIGTLPATLWLLFATWYFGFPLPNTWYAKVSTGAPWIDRLHRGMEYLGNSLAWDSLSHLAVFALLLLAWRRRHAVARLALCGIGLYYGYILFQAAATHMSGRLFSVPFFVALLLLSRLWPSRRLALAAAVGLVGLNLLNPLAPVKMGTSAYHARKKFSESALDACASVHQFGPHVFFGHQGDPNIPDHEWFQKGLEFREQAARVNVGGPGGGEPIGYFGFAAGPEKIVVDYCGLADPLLARLPACNTDTPGRWKSGHFYRLPPAGYVTSLAQGTNVIVDPEMREYYDHLRPLVRGADLWSWSRLVGILRFNLGTYDYLLIPYSRMARTVLGGRDFRQLLKEHLERDEPS